MPPIPIVAYPFSKQDTDSATVEAPASPRRTKAKGNSRYEYEHEHWGDVPSTPVRSSKRGMQSRSLSPTRRRKSAVGAPSTAPSSSPRKGTRSRPSSPTKRHSNAHRHQHEKVKIDFSPRRQSRNSASLSPTRRRQSLQKDQGQQESKEDAKRNRRGSLNLTSLLQSLGEIRDSLLSPRHDSKGVVTTPARPSPVTPKKPATKKETPPMERRASTASTPKSPSNKRKIVKGTPPPTNKNRESKEKRPPASPRKADRPRDPANSGKRRAPSTPTKMSPVASPERKRQAQNKKRHVRRNSLPQNLPLTGVQTAEKEVIGILKASSYPRGPILRRDGKVYEDHWAETVEESESDTFEDEEESVEDYRDPFIVEERHRDEDMSPPRKTKGKPKKKSQILPDPVSTAPMYLPPNCYIVQSDSDEEAKADDGNDDYFAGFDVSDYFDILNVEFEENVYSTERSESKIEDHSSEPSNTDLSSKEKLVVEKDLNDKNSKKEQDEDSVTEICCNACGLSSSCIPEPMVSCPKCWVTFYCSVDCLNWDRASGDHLSDCCALAK